MDSEYGKWLESITHLKDKVILPDQTTIDKTKWIKPNGFDVKGFNEYLERIYNAKYKKDGRE